VELASIGDRFARKRREAILVVPPALASDESNWLLSPDHPDFRQKRAVRQYIARLVPPSSFPLDFDTSLISNLWAFDVPLVGDGSKPTTYSDNPSVSTLSRIMRSVAASIF